MAAGAQLTAMAKGSGSIIRPGSQLTRAAQALVDPQRALGKFEYQWLYPGPNAQMALPNGSIAIPQIISPALTALGTVLSYEVPDGMRFIMRGLTMNAFAADWTPGSGQLLFTMRVVFATGPRNVEFVQNMAFPLGTFERPWPFECPIQLAPRDVAEVLVTNVGLPTPGANDFAYALLNGFTAPQSEF